MYDTLLSECNQNSTETWIRLGPTCDSIKIKYGCSGLLNSMFWNYRPHLLQWMVDNPLLYYSKKIIIYHYAWIMGLSGMIPFILIKFIKTDINENLLLLFSIIPIIGCRLMSWIIEDKCVFSKIVRPGFYMQGGMILEIVACLLLEYNSHNNLGIQILDVGIIYVCIIEIAGRIGCLNYGCCYGRKTECPIALCVYYKNNYSKMIQLTNDKTYNPIVAVQLLSGVLLSIPLIIILFIYPLFEPNTEYIFKIGYISKMLCLYYTSVRTIQEYYRNDTRGNINTMPLTLFINICIFCIAFIIPNNISENTIIWKIPNSFNDLSLFYMSIMFILNFIWYGIRFN